MIHRINPALIAPILLLSLLPLTAGCGKKDDTAPPPAALSPATASASPLPGHTATELKQVQQDDDAAAKRVVTPK